MTLSSHLVPSNVANFHNLALVICHLFIDGHFRSVHILYEPNIFFDHFINDIESICPRPISWESTDVTKLSSLSRRSVEHTDHILQLIFLDPTSITAKIDKSRESPTFYRLFIFFRQEKQI